MKSLGLELVLMFIIALLAVSLVEIRATPLNPDPTFPQTTIEEKAQPHQTHPNMLLISFTVYPTQAPIIEEVRLLSEGRVSKPLPGDNHLKLIAQDGQVLYNLSFFADFVLIDGPAQTLDKMNYSYVLPYTEQVAKVALSTPQGEVIRKIPSDIKEQP